MGGADGRGEQGQEMVMVDANGDVRCSGGGGGDDGVGVGAGE